MGMSPVLHNLRWEMHLTSAGYTCWTLTDVASGVRWGWAVNAPVTGWAAHTGDWGQASSIGQPAPPIAEQLARHDTAAEARSWVEEIVAATWRLCDGR